MKRKNIKNPVPNISPELQEAAREERRKMERDLEALKAISNPQNGYLENLSTDDLKRMIASASIEREQLVQERSRYDQTTGLGAMRVKKITQDINDLQRDIRGYKKIIASRRRNPQPIANATSEIDESRHYVVDDLGRIVESFKDFDRAVDRAQSWNERGTRDTAGRTFYAVDGRDVKAMMEAQRNPQAVANARRTYAPGTRFRVSEGAGLASGKTGVITNEYGKLSEEDRGYARKPGWVVVRYDSGQVDTLPKTHLLVDNPKTVANPSGADEIAAYELYTASANTEALERQANAFRKNYITKMARGVYDRTAAVRGIMHLMEATAKDYVKGGGAKWFEMFDKPTRELAAVYWVEDFEREAAEGAFDDMLPKKYRKNEAVANARGRSPVTLVMRFENNQEDRVEMSDFKQATKFIRSWAFDRDYSQAGLRIFYDGEEFYWNPAREEIESRTGKIMNSGARKANPGNGNGNLFNAHKLDELSGIFQGEISGEQIETVGSDYTPGVLTRLGKLSLLKIQNGGDTYEIRFRGDAWLGADSRKNLYIEGKSARIRNVTKPQPGELTLLGTLEQVNYITSKRHIENGRKVEYWHPLGEVDGVKPSVFIDSDGFPLIVGGNYDIGTFGIEN